MVFLTVLFVDRADRMLRNKKFNFIEIAPPVILAGSLFFFRTVLGATALFALFTTLLLFSQMKYFVKLKFALPWWAYSFPMAAMTIASTIMLEKVGGTFFAVLVPVLMTLLLLLVGMLVVRTLLAMKRGQICVPE